MALHGDHTRPETGLDLYVSTVYVKTLEEDPRFVELLVQTRDGDYSFAFDIYTAETVAEAIEREVRKIEGTMGLATDKDVKIQPTKQPKS